MGLNCAGYSVVQQGLRHSKRVVLFGLQKKAMEYRWGITSVLLPVLELFVVVVLVTTLCKVAFSLLLVHLMSISPTFMTMAPFRGVTSIKVLVPFGRTCRPPTSSCASRVMVP